VQYFSSDTFVSKCFVDQCLVFLSFFMSWVSERYCSNAASVVFLSFRCYKPCQLNHSVWLFSGSFSALSSSLAIFQGLAIVQVSIWLLASSSHCLMLYLEYLGCRALSNLQLADSVCFSYWMVHTPIPDCQVRYLFGLGSCLVHAVGRC